MEMSFSKETKRELCSEMPSSDKAMQAFVYGMVLFSKVFSYGAVSFATESRPAATAYSAALSSLTGVIVDTRTVLTRRRGESRMYTLTVPDSSDCARVFDHFGHDDKAASLRINRANIDSEEELPFFLRGAFLVCGSVTDPEKDYHMEFVVPHMNLAKDLSRLIGEIEIISCQANMVRRKGSYVVYIKGSDSIADMLAYMGAPMASLEIIQQKIYRSVRNKANRQRNSDVANSNKTASAAAKQLAAILKIRQTMGLEALTAELRELALLREEHPEYNLRELGESLSTPISRSGVNHRLNRLMEIAEENGDDGSAT